MSLIPLSAAAVKMANIVYPTHDKALVGFCAQKILIYLCNELYGMTHRHQKKRELLPKARYYLYEKDLIYRINGNSKEQMYGNVAVKERGLKKLIKRIQDG